MKFLDSDYLETIETSHPSRVRGLKCEHPGYRAPGEVVAPFTGAWVEIASRP